MYCSVRSKYLYLQDQGWLKKVPGLRSKIQASLSPCLGPIIPRKYESELGSQFLSEQRHVPGKPALVSGYLNHFRIVSSDASFHGSCAFEAFLSWIEQVSDGTVGGNKAVFVYF